MRARKSKFDERIALLGLCLDKITEEAGRIGEMENECVATLKELKEKKSRALEISAEEKSSYAASVADLKSRSAILGRQFNALFTFCEEVYTGSQELLLLVTELTINPHASNFISHYGCESYFKHNKNLMFYERNQEIETRLNELN